MDNPSAKAIERRGRATDWWALLLAQFALFFHVVFSILLPRVRSHAAWLDTVILYTVGFFSLSGCTAALGALFIARCSRLRSLLALVVTAPLTWLWVGRLMHS